MLTSSISVTSGSLIKRVYNIHAKSKDTADAGLLLLLIISAVSFFFWNTHEQSSKVY